MAIAEPDASRPAAAESADVMRDDTSALSSSLGAPPPEPPSPELSDAIAFTADSESPASNASPTWAAKGGFHCHLPTLEC